MARRERQRSRAAGRQATHAGPTAGRADTADGRGQIPAPGPPEGWADLANHPLIRGGLYAWALIGLLAVALAVLFAVAQVRLVVVPVLLALFPAALLTPPTNWLQRRGVPRALAALAVLLGGLGLLLVVGQFILGRAIAEAPQLGESIRQGWDDLQAFFATGPLGIDPTWIRDSLAAAQERVIDSDIVRTGVLGVASAVAEMVAMLLLLLVVLFFYLKDGTKIATWGRDLFPRRLRSDVQAMGLRAWTTIAAYIRGQLLVALVDAIGIGVGLAILGVPLALPLGVLVFFGGLFPIIGAIVTGAFAVLVALADGGPVIALIALGIVVAVQQLESNILAPLVLGKATALHPLAVLTSLTAGGILLGVLGAFIAVPIAASLVRAIGYLRERSEAAV